MDVRRTPGDLREACLVEAMAIIEQEGLEKLSLREVARRLGVSHQAPYRHYPSRDHLLVEVMRRCFRDFATFLDDRAKEDDPRKDLDVLRLVLRRLHGDQPAQKMMGAAMATQDSTAAGPAR